MQTKMKVAFLVAVAFGLVAAYGVYDFLRAQRRAIEALHAETQPVVVTAREVAAGTPLAGEMLKVVPYLKTSLPSGFFASPEGLAGKVVATKMAAGEPVVQSRLADKAGLTTLLAPGNRAMAIKVNEIVGVSGFIAPEDRVDVIANVLPPGGNRQSGQVSKIVLQNKRVLSVAQKVEGRKDGKPEIASSITLELTPEESETLSLASLEGQILLALRSGEDSQIVATSGRTTGDLLGRRAAAKSKRPASSSYEVVVYQGTARSVVNF